MISNEQLPSILSCKQQTKVIFNEKLKESYSNQKILKDNQSYIKQFLQNTDNKYVKINSSKLILIKLDNTQPN